MNTVQQILNIATTTESVVVKVATEPDWPRLHVILARNFAEDSFMRHTPADYKIHEHELENTFNIVVRNEKILGQVVLIAKDSSDLDGDFIGYLSGSTIGTKRQPHVATFHMWVEPESRGKRVGYRLVQEFINWCSNIQLIQKIELDVMANNDVGLSLYKKFGFEVEGRRKKTALKNGEYFDLVQMGLWLKKTTLN